MADAKQAAAAAIAYARDLYGDAELKHLRLEELTLSQDEKVWNVTLGWTERGVYDSTPALNPYVGGEIKRLPRVYKVFQVDADSGKVYPTVKMYQSS